MGDVRLCSAAETEYTNSLRWYAERSVDAALEFDAEFDVAVREISSDPRRYPACDDRHHYFLMRRFPFQIT